MPTKEQLRSTTHQFCVLNGIGDAGALIGDSPYNVVVAANRMTYSLARTRWALNVFPGVPIPYLCQRTLQVCAGQLSLHIMPHLIWEGITWRQVHAQFAPDADMTPAPFAAPPTEADLAAVFIAAMSLDTDQPGTAGLGLAVALACQQMSWRTVASTVNALDESTRRHSQDVAAILAALSAPPTSGTTR